MDLSNHIYRSTKKYGIPSRIFTAILMQESGYKLDAKNCTTGHDRESDEIRTVCSDFGIAQIHYDTIESYGFDKDLLTSDITYSIDAGAKVLKWFYDRYEPRESKWYCRYNVGTRPIAQVRTACNTYVSLVSRYL